MPILVGCSDGLRGSSIGFHLGGEEDELDVGNLGLDIVADVGCDIGVDEAQFGGGDLDAVREGVAGEVVVDEGGLGADAPKSKPDENEGI